jgi:hypothetical protein
MAFYGGKYQTFLTGKFCPIFLLCAVPNFEPPKRSLLVVVWHYSQSCYFLGIWNGIVTFHPSFFWV